MDQWPQNNLEGFFLKIRIHEMNAQGGNKLYALHIKTNKYDTHY